MSLAEASTLYMNAARNICASLLLGASLLCLTSWAEEELTPEQRVLVENFHRPVSTLGEAMNTARTALKGISDTAGADAAAPAVSAVIRAEKEVSEAAARLTEAGLNVSSLYKKGQLAKAISSLPIAAYNADIQATLANGCCGSVKLYLTITGTSATDEQLHNTLNAPAVVANFKAAPLRTDNYITRYRAGVGAKLRITRNHRLDFYYYFDYDRGYNIDYKANKGDLKGYLQENEFRHIFGISYKFKL